MEAGAHMEDYTKESGFVKSKESYSLFVWRLESDLVSTTWNLQQFRGSVDRSIQIDVG